MAPPSHVICLFWLQGNCKFGDECRFLHPPTDQEKSNGQSTPKKRTSTVAGFSDAPAKKVQVHKCPPPRPALKYIYAVVCETSIETSESYSQNVKASKRKKSTTRVTEKTDKKMTRDVQGIYTTIKRANAKAADLQEDESEERKKHVEDDQAEDGRISWKLEIGTEKTEVKVEKWELDDGEDDEEVQILLGNGNSVRDDATIPPWQEMDPGELTFDIEKYSRMFD